MNVLPFLFAYGIFQCNYFLFPFYQLFLCSKNISILLKRNKRKKSKRTKQTRIKRNQKGKRKTLVCIFSKCTINISYPIWSLTKN